MTRKAPWICQASDDCMHVNRPHDLKCRQCGAERSDDPNAYSTRPARPVEGTLNGKPVTVLIDGGGAEDMTAYFPPQDFTVMHGHVTPRQDGQKARCGGPGLCATCDREFVVLHRKRMEEQGKVLMDAATGVDVSAAVQLFARSHVLRNVLGEIGRQMGVTFVVDRHNEKRINMLEGGGDLYISEMYVRDEHGRVSLHRRALYEAPQWVRDARYSVPAPSGAIELNDQIAAVIDAALRFTACDGDLFGNDGQQALWVKLDEALAPFRCMEYPPK